MVSEISSDAHKTTDDTSNQHKDRPENNELNWVTLVKSGDSKQVPSGNDTAGQYLPAFAIGGVSGSDTTQPPASTASTDSTQSPTSSASNEEKRGATTIKKDEQGNAKEYSNGDYTLAKHDDGKWYYHQNGEGHDFVEVNSDSIRIDDEGKVTYAESGLFGKDDQTLGDGSTGFVTSITSAANHVADAAVNHPLDTFNTIAFAPLAAVDAIAGTHTIEAIGEIEKGAVNEVINHPGEILKDVAIGAAIGALTVATGGGALVALGIGAATLATTELVKNDGDINGVLKDAQEFGSTVANWGSDLATVAGPGQHTAEETAAAVEGLHELGAFGAHIAAGTAGGVAGGVGAEIVGLEGALPNAVRAGVSRLRGGSSEGADGASIQTSTAGRPDSLPEGDPIVDAPTQPIPLKTEAQNIAESMENRGAFTLPDGRAIDANSITVMKSAGLTQDSYVYRTMDPKYLNMENGTVSPNPNSMAAILNPETPPKLTVTLENGQKVELRPSSNAKDAGPGLNVAKGIPEGYRDPGHALIGIRLGDMLESNGRIFLDQGAAMSGCYYVTFDGAVPFYYIP